MGPRHLLLIEDDPDDILLMGRAFSRAEMGEAVSVVKDGEEAVGFLERTSEAESVRREPLPSLILLDLHLPGRSGLEVLEWIREQPHLRRIPVVVLTSAWNDDALERAYDLGANSFLVKPVKFDQLVETVRVLKQYWLGLNQHPRGPKPRPDPR